MHDLDLAAEFGAEPAPWLGCSSVPFWACSFWVQAEPSCMAQNSACCSATASRSAFWGGKVGVWRRGVAEVMVKQHTHLLHLIFVYSISQLTFLV